MIHKIDNVILEDDVVRLQPLEVTDFEHLLPFALNEPEIWKFSLVPTAGEHALRTYIETAIKERDAGTEYPFVVFDKRTNRYAGSTRFYDIQLEKGTLQLGYTWYGKDFQGTGLNKHCKFLLLQYAFETLQVERVEFRADSRNIQSRTALEKIGAIYEGELRNHMVLWDGYRRSSVYYSILADEWPEVRKARFGM